ncbi:hypothetical protein NBRGN_067_00340 [Nocardia brasiliensis NBRC 14402]|nr:hypothetical protein NBRGN_067_00340 [Nocardia brasiliensis NBRC 14402]
MELGFGTTAGSSGQPVSVAGIGVAGASKLPAVDRLGHDAHGYLAEAGTHADLEDIAAVLGILRLPRGGYRCGLVCVAETSAESVGSCTTSRDRPVRPIDTSQRTRVEVVSAPPEPVASPKLRYLPAARGR